MERAAPSRQLSGYPTICVRIILRKLPSSHVGIIVQLDLEAPRTGLRGSVRGIFLTRNDDAAPESVGVHAV